MSKKLLFNQFSYHTLILSLKDNWKSYNHDFIFKFEHPSTALFLAEK